MLALGKGEDARSMRFVTSLVIPHADWQFPFKQQYDEKVVAGFSADVNYVNDLQIDELGQSYSSNVLPEAIPTFETTSVEEATPPEPVQDLGCIYPSDSKTQNLCESQSALSQEGGIEPEVDRKVKAMHGLRFDSSGNVLIPGH